MPNLFPIYEGYPSVAPQGDGSSAENTVATVTVVPGALQLVPVGISSAELNDSVGSLTALRVGVTTVVGKVLGGVIFTNASIRLILLG